LKHDPITARGRTSETYNPKNSKKETEHNSPVPRDLRSYSVGDAPKLREMVGSFLLKDEVIIGEEEPKAGLDHWIKNREHIIVGKGQGEGRTRRKKGRLHTTEKNLTDSGNRERDKGARL